MPKPTLPTNLSGLLEHDRFPAIESKADYKKELKTLQRRMLRAQQGIWHQKARVVIVFEGFDASGKGGAIRRLGRKLDPRGVQVHSIGPPEPNEAGRHYLYRFWDRLPPPGTIAVFDRSWYGRVLVERVDELAPAHRWKRAYKEIRQFERMLYEDGVTLIKIFMAISKAEQYRRFEARLHDPYKQWKLGEPDVRARSQWDAYVEAVDDMLKKTHLSKAPWNIIAADDKKHGRIEVLKTVTKALKPYAKWMDRQAEERDVTGLEEALRELR